MDAVTSVEKPLNGGAKALLIACAGLLVFLFYLWALVSILFLLVLVALEIALIVVLARFGLAAVALIPLRSHIPLIGIFFRSLPLREPAEFRIPLKREDAPGLFVMLETLCRRLQLAPPDTVFLEMHLNAWVRLKGYKRGAGRTLLGIGYDLMAGLSAGEVEAVLAHEMVHAKLIQRGVSNWLKTGLPRITTLAMALNANAEMHRRTKRGAYLSRALLRAADRFARLGTRLVATYSRQEEFAADRGAAELCGAAVGRSALTVLRTLYARTARIPWRERVSQLQLGEGFSQWLVQELTQTDLPQSPEATKELFNRYSTHPTMSDRLAALPQDPASSPTQVAREPGIGLLAEPDALAEKLMAEIQRTVAEQEEKDSRALRRWRRKASIGRAHLQPLQLVGVAVGIAGVVIAAFVVLDSRWWFGSKIANGLIALVPAVTAGTALYLLGRYRDRVELPVPDYALLKEAFKKTRDSAGREDAEKQMENEFRERVAKEKKHRRRAAMLASESYAALGKCEYLKAHVAARLCLQYAPKSVEGALALAVASGALGQSAQVTRMLAFLNQRTGLTGQSTIWGTGWALYLCGIWIQAEAFLDLAHGQRPGEPTILTLLAISRSRRGKLQSAIMNARQACATEAANKEHGKVLIQLLLEGGYLREAQERLMKLEAEIPGDAELMLATTRMNLMQRKFDAADEWTERLKQGSAGPHMLVQLGEIYESARKDEKAAALFNQALETAFYPAALLGLARIEALRHNRELAQGHLLSALNTKRPLGENGTGPLPLFHQIVAGLRMLQEPKLNCQTWIASFEKGTGPAALLNVSLIVCAQSREEAEKHVAMIVRAMDPESSPLSPAGIGWKKAPKEQQPVGPTCPGILGALS
jgi:Zn-dependent protease with chaperone function/tetratricopeptide (TPR) repeat protein